MTYKPSMTIKQVQEMVARITEHRVAEQAAARLRAEGERLVESLDTASAWERDAIEAAAVAAVFRLGQPPNRFAEAFAAEEAAREAA